MRLDFENLLVLLLIIPAMATVIFSYYKYSNRSDRQKLFLTLRMLAIACIILSMSSASIIKYAKDITTVFVCDRSDSTRDNTEAIEAFINDAIDDKTGKDIVGILAFGQNSVIENSPSKDIIFNGFQTTVNSSFTNIQRGLISTSTIFPLNTRKRVVLITDGYENDGESERQLMALAQNGYAVDIVPLYKNDFSEVQISEIEIPDKASKNQMIDIVVHVNSNIDTEGTILVYSGDHLKYEQGIDIENGDNKYIFTDEVTEGGLLSYRVEVVPKTDTYTENNSLSSYTIVDDEPYILIVEDEDQQGQKLIELFENTANIEVTSPQEVPREVASLLKYDAFILADIPLDKLSNDFVENLESVVKNQGKGLLVTGGDSSYGPGGYFQTTLEGMLPVDSDVNSKEEQPNLGLVLVIDKSGSMNSGRYGITKLELAKEAAIRSTEVLDDKDMLGVIGFDDSIKWVVDLQKVEDKEGLQDDIGTIVPGGGTTIRPSLEEAVDALKDADVTLKHIILLTDGQAETTGYEGVLEDIGENEITLSTVAVGDSADRQLLEMLALEGGGRYYATDEFTDIPSIFTKEAFMAGKKYLNNISFMPDLVSYTNMLKGLETLPQLDGYVSTSVKPNARLVLSGPDGDPILASMQYGLGRTVAWTSDTNGFWTSNLFSWDNGATFWNNIISYIVNKEINKNYTVDTAYESGKGVIIVNSTTLEESVSEIEGKIILPDGTEKEIVLEASSPGEYTSDFVPTGEGVYMVDLTVDNGNENLEKIITGVNVGYSLEYDFYENTRMSFERMAEITGGRILDDPSEVFKGNVEEVRGSYNISNILLIIALLLFMFEIIIRKTNIGGDKFFAIFRWPVKGVSKVLEKVKGRGRGTISHKKSVVQNVTRKDNAENLEINNVSKAVGEKAIDEMSSDGIKKKKQRKYKKDSKTEVDSSHIDVLLAKKRKE